MVASNSNIQINKKYVGIKVCSHVQVTYIIEAVDSYRFKKRNIQRKIISIREKLNIFGRINLYFSPIEIKVFFKNNKILKIYIFQTYFSKQNLPSHFP